MANFALGPPTAGSRAVMAVTEIGPGVTVATWGERGDPAHLVDECGPGVELVFFNNGLPPGAGESHAAARSAAAIAAYEAQGREEEELLLLPPT